MGPEQKAQANSPVNQFRGGEQPYSAQAQEWSNDLSAIKGGTGEKGQQHEWWRLLWPRARRAFGDVDGVGLRMPILCAIGRRDVCHHPLFVSAVEDDSS